jgi:2-hydroxychromene-2-carboxylate isomerase
VSDLTPAFYFDLASPLAYLVAERIGSRLPGAEWEPVLARELTSQDTDTEPDAAAIERLAEELGLMAVRWPEDFPSDSEKAMLVATYAKSVGRTVAFAQAAFRQAFAAGRSLAETDNLLVAAAACELHPRAVLKGTELDSIEAQLHETTRAAAGAGVTKVPAIRIGGRVLAGERALEFATEDATVPA